MGMNHLFEACTGNLQSVREALRGGAERIELCAALPLGGLTPSLGMVRAVREMAPRLTAPIGKTTRRRLRVFGG